MIATTNEKCIVVSMSTQSLDAVQKLCEARGWPTLRIDGATPASKRQPIVERFNSHDYPERVMLLSSKSGGAGLNLTGASRMIMLDLSWNPADDAQAAARSWREGQKRPVYVYRLVATGTLEENMLQRQVEKAALSNAMMHEGQGKGSKQKFSAEELRKIFRFNGITNCATHDALKCRCHLVKAKVEEEDEDEEESRESESEEEGPAKKRKTVLKTDSKAESEKEKEKLSGLRDEYRHMIITDTSAAREARESIKEGFSDAVLSSALELVGGRVVSAVFANTRNSES